MKTIPSQLSLVFSLIILFLAVACSPPGVVTQQVLPTELAASASNLTKTVEPTSTTPSDTPSLSLPTNTPIPSVAATSTSLDVESTLISPQDGMVLVFVPAGEFTMGSENGGDDEKPAHTVYLDEFWIDQTEVTNAMYAKCIQEGVCFEPLRIDYYEDPEFANSPVDYVTWYDANVYCTWAGRRLPTEAEWEKAASWDDENQVKRIYPWGDEIDCSFANHYSENGLEDGCMGYPVNVGSYPAGTSFYGAFDMAGNVMEWVADWYSDTYYFEAPSDNPKGPEVGEYKLLRGGAFLNNSQEIRSSARFSAGDLWETFFDLVGFRCAYSE